MYQLNEDDIGFSHLSVLMGGPEIAFELTHLLKDEKWDMLWNQFCKLYAAPKEVVEKEFGKSIELGDPGPWYARLPAYYSKVTGNKEYAERAWNNFLMPEKDAIILILIYKSLMELKVFNLSMK
ncbi:MAG: hypothetical protein H6613_03520 [Ignavibacteriales bacterium]|nr:hypothetical protein [Ignavibacteriales bacterium]